jgi:hypothetical protein
MPPSKLDQVQSISAQFNVSADVALEKRVGQHQLTKEEQLGLFDLRKTLTDRINQEKESFNDPQEYEWRVRDKYAELAEKNNVPQPEHFPEGMRNRTIPPHQLLAMAHVGVKRDHAVTLNAFNADYQRGVNETLNRAATDGRGPQRNEPEQGRAQTQTQDRERERD